MVDTVEAKIDALLDAGVHVVEHLAGIGPAARRILDALPRSISSYLLTRA